MSTGRKWGLSFLCLAIIACLMAVAGHYYLRRGTERYKATLRARREYLSLSQAWPKPLQGDHDKGGAFMQAILQVSRGAVLGTNQVRVMRALTFGRAMVASSQPEIRDRKNGTNSWADLARELDTNASLLEQLRAALDAPGFDFNLYYPAAFEVPLPHLAKGMQAANLLSMATALALHQKELELARTNLMSMLSLSKAFRKDRFVISELVQIAIAHIAAAAAWEAFQTPDWRDSQLESLQAAWSSQEFLEPMRDALTFERALSLDTMRDYREAPRKMLRLTHLGGSGGSSGSPDVMEELLGGTVRAGMSFLWTYYWSYDDELRFLRVSQVHLEALRQTNCSWKAASEFMKNRLQRLEIKPARDSREKSLLDYPEANLHSFFSDMALHQENSIGKALGAQTLKEIVAAAIALKRYKLRHGRPPSRLEDLLPAFMSRLPIDFMDGQPLRYRLETNNVSLLYSVGADGVDGGGLPEKSRTSPRAWNLEADWVWPKPATAAEVEEYEASEAAKPASPAREKSRSRP